MTAKRSHSSPGPRGAGDRPIHRRRWHTDHRLLRRARGRQGGRARRGRVPEGCRRAPALCPRLAAFAIRRRAEPTRHSGSAALEVGRPYPDGGLPDDVLSSRGGGRRSGHRDAPTSGSPRRSQQALRGTAASVGRRMWTGALTSARARQVVNDINPGAATAVRRKGLRACRWSATTGTGVDRCRPVPSRSGRLTLEPTGCSGNEAGGERWRVTC